LWAGLVPYYGSSAMTLLGSPAELAEIFLEYKRIGVTQFIISGWPKLDEMLIFGHQVLPLVRELESQSAQHPTTWNKPTTRYDVSKERNP